MKIPPKTAKGAMRHIEVACAAWVDLLGYGAMLQSANFDLTSSAARIAIDRLFEFQKLVAKHSSRYMPTFVMNDGAVAYRDLSPRSRSVTYDFIRRAYDLFQDINSCDRHDRGFPGARVVLAAGFRLRRDIDFSAFLNSGKAKSIKRKLDDGLISQNQALNEAFKCRNTHDTTPELQGNFAFTKAYLADDAGTAGGLGGPNFFIDMALFDSPAPEWILCSRYVEWASRGITATFGQIERIDSKSASLAEHAGVRDAFAVAKSLSNAHDVEIDLKARRVTRKR